MIARYPVTFGEYAEFLAAVDREEGAEVAKRRVPQTPCGGELPYLARREDGTYRPQSHIVEGAAHERCVREHGADYLDGVPVMGVCFDEAVAYCAWKTRVTGMTWRLPTEEEREKAARGVDGRRFPWGDLEDGTLAKCRDSRSEATQPEPVGTFKTAESVYGMDDAAGGIYDWTDSWFDSRRSARVLRGGSWRFAPVFLRAAYRFSSSPSFRLAGVGFRCARSP